MTPPTTTEYAQDRGTQTATVQQQSLSERRTNGSGRSVPVSTASDASNPRLTTLADQTPASAMLYRLRTSRAARPSAVTFQRLEVREGVVLDVGSEAFRARLVDPRGIEPDEEVEIEIDSLSRSDLPMVAQGALFFWAIGYVTRATGRRQLTLKVEFRRLRPGTRGARERARRAGREYAEESGWT